MTQTYATPAAFRTALDERLRRDPRGLAFARRRLVFERLLVRLVAEFGDDIVLKGGLALVQRHSDARSTKDVDLRVVGEPSTLLQRVQRAGRMVLNDHLNFEVSYVGPMANPGLKYDAHRYRVTPTIAGRRYPDPEWFHLDCAFAEPIVGEIETRSTSDTLAFIGEPPARIRIYPIVSHIAEKLHAYSFVYEGGRPSSRVKDLPDILLLATIAPIDAANLRGAIKLTFEHRATHAVPRTLDAPSDAWRRPYAEIAREARLRWDDLANAHTAAAAFLDPVLDPGRTITAWEPSSWTWR